MKGLADFIPDVKEREFYKKLAAMAGKYMADATLECHLAGDLVWAMDYCFTYKGLRAVLYYHRRKAVLFPSLATLDASTPERLLEELDEAADPHSFVRMVTDDITGKAAM